MAHPTAAGDHHGAVVYGFDAVRVPIRLAASCDRSDQAMAAGIWQALGREVFGRDAFVDLDLRGFRPTRHPPWSPSGS